MPSTNTPNMNLIAPTVGSQPGPTWAQNVNSDLSIIDGHDHTAGNGVPITPSGISITSDLSFMSNNAIDLRSIRLVSQASPLSAAADNQSLSVSGVDLYYLDGDGNSIRITQSGGIAGSPGSIAGLASPASATYVSGTPAFVWQSDSNKAANLDAGSIVIRKLTVSSPGITVSAPSGLASNYTLTLPTAPPAGVKIMTMDNSGNVGVTYDVDNVTLEVASSLLRIKDNTPLTGNVVITGTLAGSTGTLQVTGAIQTSGNATIGGGTINVGGSGTTPLIVGRTASTIDIVDQTNSQSRTIVTSANPAHAGLMIVRGLVDGTTGNVLLGEGWTGVRNALGSYTITFTTPFFDAPVVTATASTNGFSMYILSQSTSSFHTITNSVDSTFNFIAIGQRP